VSNIP